MLITQSLAIKIVNREEFVVCMKARKSLNKGTSDLISRRPCTDKRTIMKFHQRAWAIPLPVTSTGRQAAAVKIPQMKKQRPGLATLPKIYGRLSKKIIP